MSRRRKSYVRKSKVMGSQLKKEEGGNEHRLRGGRMWFKIISVLVGHGG